MKGHYLYTSVTSLVHRYEKDPSLFDWYQRWSGLQTLVQKHVKKSCDVLHVGTYVITSV